MHILYLYQYFTTRQGIGHTRCYEFAKRFVWQGHKVTVVTAGSSTDTFTGCHQEVVDGVKVIKLRAGYSDYIAGTRLSYAARIRAFLSFSLKSTLFCLTSKELRDVDVIYASSPPLTVALPALLASWLRRTPLVFEVRDCWPEAPIQMGALNNPVLISLARLLERLIYRRSEHLVALSPGMRDEMIQSSGVDPSKVSVIPNCADLDLFRPDVPGGDAVRKRLGTEGKFVCLYFGAMGEVNGLHAVLDSAEVLKQLGERVVFVLCGHGKERQSLEARAQQLRLDNVRFAPSVPKAAVAEIVAAADVCLTHFKNVPILYTCSPNKLFDALSAGKLVIVNTPGWTKALLEEHRAGFYANPEDPGDLARTLAHLSRTPELVKRYGENARRLAETAFSRDKHAVRLLNVLTAASQGSELFGERRGES